MNERDLTYFCHLVEAGNYTETAKQFNVTQPAISAAVKRLEDSYGTPLLTQQNHRAQLVTTPAGRVLYIKARKLIKEFAQVKLEVTHANEQQVRLGFSHVAGGIWLPPMIEQFIKYDLLPLVDTQVAPSVNLLEALRNGKLDAAVFSTLQPEQSSDLNVTQLEIRHFYLLANVHHPLSRLSMVSAMDLKDVPIIARPKHTLPRTALDRLCRQQSVQPKIIYEADSNQMVARLVSRNLGVGLVIGNSLPLNANVVEVPLKSSESIACYMQLAVRNSFLPNERQQQCLNLLKQVKST
ncbi:LysR family transcriptional regulator [Secundilactobacillus muriivasis]